MNDEARGAAIEALAGRLIAANAGSADMHPVPTGHCTRALLVALAALLASATPAEAQASRDRAQELLRQADAAIGRETVESAREAIRVSRSALTLIGVRGSTPPPPTAAAVDRMIAGRAFLFTGMAYRILGQPDSLMRYLQRALPLNQSSQDPSGESLTLIEMGMAAVGRAQPDSGVVLLRRALAISERDLGAHAQIPALLKLGVALGNAGREDSARVVLFRGATLARDNRDPVALAHALRFLGGSYGKAARLDSALVFYRAAEQLLTALKDSTNVSTVQSELAQVFHRLNVLDSALVYSTSALSIQRSRSMYAAMMATYRGRGIIFARLRMADSAVAATREALALARRLDMRETEAAIESELAMGLVRTQPDSAIIHARQALERSDALSVTDRVYAKQALAIAHLALGRKDSSLVHAVSAAREPRASLSQEMIYQVVGVAGITHYALGDWVAAAAYADTATALHARAGRNVGSDFARVAFGDNDARIYRMWTNAWVEQTATLGERAWFAALAATERGRGQALLDLMTDSSAVIEPGADLAAEGVAIMQRALRHADVVISYAYFDDAIMVWSLEKGGVLRAAIVAESPDSVLTAINEFRAYLGVDRAARGLALRGEELERGSVAAAAASRTDDWRAAGLRLRRMLLPDSLDALLKPGRQVVIVPAGAVSVVPFAALPAAKGDGVLSDAVSIRYGPSLATLAAVENLPQSASTTSLVVSNPLMPLASGASGTRVQLGSLPGAEAEGTDVARRLSASPYKGAAATETAIRLRMPYARIVHIASHGYAFSSEAQARNSFVALAPDTQNDGLLTVSEILGDPALKLSADLVTLSACQTGLGDLRETEGTIGLQRAFLGRGARSVLVSLWSVSDEATRLLMDRFYAHWIDDRDKPDKAESLRRAQADVRRRREYSEPKFWAGFQVVGAR